MIPSRDHVRTVCALHRQHAPAIGTPSADGDAGADVWQVLIASIIHGSSESLPPGPGGAGGAIAPTFEIREAQTIPATAQAETQLAAILNAHAVDLIVRVLPGSSALTRVVGLPDAHEGGTETGASQIADALSLIAETELPSALPPYRRAAGLVLPGRSTGRRPVGLLTGWPGSAAAGPSIGGGLPEVFVAEPAALAGLAQTVGGVECAWSIEGSSVNLVCAGAEKTVIRAARISGSDAQAGIRRVIGESAKAAGLSDAASDRAFQPLVLRPSPGTSRIGGQSRDERWVRSFGIAAGAIALYADPSPAVHGLVSLHEIEPQLKPPVLVRITRFFARPAVAASLLILAVLLAVGVPIAASYARVRILEKQIADERSLIERNTADERDLAFYRLLGEKRWPMTKLLADIAGASPVGVTLDAVELGVGEQVVLRGIAENSGQITTFRENLGKTRIFGEVATPSTTPGPDGVSFTLNARVAPGAARFVAPPIDDFAARPLVDRLHGDGPRASTRRNANAGSRRDRPSATPVTSRSTTSPSSARAPVVSTTPSREPVVIPPPLSDAAIAKLDRLEAMREWGARRKAATQPGIDEETRKRLTSEYEKARARMQQFNQAGGGGGQ